MLLVEYKEISYIPSDSFQQSGLFAKNDFGNASVINGVVGFLAGYNCQVRSKICSG